jgi:hypothetical protein
MAGKLLVGYVKVSTAQQGRSGLGFEAQGETLERFATSEGFTLGRVFVEAETGKGQALWSGAHTLRQHSAKRAVSGASWPRCEAGPAQP